MAVNGWSWFWITWATCTLGVFLYGELYAVADGRPWDKLSQNVWRLEDALPCPLAWRIVLMALIGWLGVHLTFGPRH